MPQSEYRKTADSKFPFPYIHICFYPCFFPNLFSPFGCDIDAILVFYNNKIPTYIADRLHYSNPLVVSSRLARRAARAHALQHPEKYDGLEKAGFRVERGGDLLYYINERLGAHYMDVGASQKIVDGQVS